MQNIKYYKIHYKVKSFLICSMSSTLLVPKLPIVESKTSECSCKKSGLIIITCENCLNKKQQVSYHVECHVDRCTSKHTHLTRGHKCGVCLEYGHGGWNHIDGKINGKVVMPSITHYSERIPEIFRTCDCKNGSVHTIEGHQCKLCGKYGHRSKNCRVAKSAFRDRLGDF